MTAAHIRVGVVGAGWWATKTHLPALTANPDARVVGVCDHQIDRAQFAAELFNVGVAVADLDEFIGLNLDCAVVATPHDSHHESAAALLDAGVDVLVEKPMTIDPNEAWDLVARAKASGVHLHVGYTHPYSSVAGHLRKHLLEGDLGDLLCVSGLFATAVEPLYRGRAAQEQGRDGAVVVSGPDTYADPQRGGGQLLTQMTHAVGLVLWLTGSTPERVSAAIINAGYSVDVANGIVMTMSSGSLASLTSVGTVHDPELRSGEYHFFGTRGLAKLDTLTGSLSVALSSGATISYAVDEPAAANPIDAPAAALVATALGRQPVVVPGAIGARAVDVLAASRESSQSHQTVTIHPGTIA